MDAQRLSDADLAAIEARTAAASPGPWEMYCWLAGYWMVEHGRNHYGPGRPDMPPCVNPACPGGPRRNLIARLYPSWAKDGTPVQANMTFIAAAREDVPRLLAEVRRLRALERAANQVFAQLEQHLAHADLSDQERAMFQRWYEGLGLAFYGVDTENPSPAEASEG